MASMNDIETKVQNIFDILDCRSVSTITGTLPMTFKADGSALVNYRVYGTAAGAGERTKNLISVPSLEPVIDHGVTFTLDPVAGTITANGTATGGQGKFAIYIKTSKTINVYLSGCPAGGSASSYNVYPWDDTAGARPKKWDGVTAQTNSDFGSGNLEVQALAGHSVSITIRIEQGYTANNLVFKPMFRPAGTTPDFIPYGYELPLTITNGTENKTSDIFIGDTKLSSGDYVDYETQTITHGDISEPAPLPLPALKTYIGTNTLDSTETLGEVTIKGKIKEVI